MNSLYPCLQGALSVMSETTDTHGGLNVPVTVMTLNVLMTTELWEARGQELRVRIQCQVTGSGRPAWRSRCALEAEDGSLRPFSLAITCAEAPASVSGELGFSCVTS